MRFIFDPVCGILISNPQNNRSCQTKNRDLFKREERSLALLAIAKWPFYFVRNIMYRNNIMPYITAFLALKILLPFQSCRCSQWPSNVKKTAFSLHPEVRHSSTSTGGGATNPNKNMPQLRSHTKPI